MERCTVARAGGGLSRIFKKKTLGLYAHLTGMGERSHLITCETGLYTHIDDLLGELKFEDLSDTIVAGCYAGLVITQLAEVAFERIRGDLARWGLTNPDDIAWVAPRLTDIPMKCHFDKLDLKRHAADSLPKTYIHCTREPMASTLKPFSENAKAKKWGYSEIDAVHDVMVTEPEKLAEIIIAMEMP
jgi:hypothetical protein